MQKQESLAHKENKYKEVKNMTWNFVIGFAFGALAVYLTARGYKRFLKHIIKMYYGTKKAEIEQFEKQLNQCKIDLDLRT